MLGRWIRALLWHPYESFCRFFPLVPFRSEVTEPVPGVQCIRIQNPVVKALARISGGYDYSVCYVVAGEGMVDTGFPWARRRLRRTLCELGLDRTLRWVVNTHYHEDHTGNNDLVTEMTRARIFAHPDAIPEIRHPRTLPFYRRFLFGPVAASEVEAVPDELRAGGFRLRVLETPGHCPGPLCLFDEDRRLLFGGDLYIAPDLDSQLSDADGPAWIRSVGRALDLEPEVLLDAHGTVVLGAGAVRALLQGKLDFLLGLEARVHEASRDARTVEEITRAVFRERSLVDKLSRSDGWLSLITGSDFSRSNLVSTFLRRDRRP